MRVWISALALLLAFCGSGLAQPNGFWNDMGPGRLQFPPPPDPEDPDPRFSPSREGPVEDILFQPGINLYGDAGAGALKDLSGSKGSQLCLPIALTHGFAYLRGSAGFPRLARYRDLDRDGAADTPRDGIRHFFQACKTDREVGTYYSEVAGCMRAYMAESGYRPWAYQISPWATEAPPAYHLASVRRVVDVDEVRHHVGARYLVVLAVGFYSFDASTKTFQREAGHFVNLYGYRHAQAWGAERIVLRIVNNWVDYGNRPPGRMYDEIAMERIRPRDGTTFPREAAYELTGPALSWSGYKTMVEGLFVALPL
ncbi:MAG TPA: hypothetical protein VEA41_13070 [Salinarimonas sp.]|nr:hypothetical protein [Salinarimonas sp.]